MLEYLKLNNVGPAPQLQMQFAPRMNLITGDNGLGKSFMLDAAWWALTRKWPRELNPSLVSGFVAKPNNPEQEASIEFGLRTTNGVQVGYESRYEVSDEAWVGHAGRPPNPGLVIYAQADGGFSVWDPARNYWKKKGDIDVQERLPAYVFSAQQVWDGLEVERDNSRRVVCNGLIRDWANWIKEDGADAKNMHLALKHLSPGTSRQEQMEPGPITWMGVDDARDIPSIKMNNAQAVPILHASSGVRRIVALAYMLLWCCRENRRAASILKQAPASQVIMIIDEIECHLHPKWQRTILGSILKMMQKLHLDAELQLLVATHSPLVLASAETLFDSQRDAWFDFDLERNKSKPVPVLHKREFVRHGDISNWLTSEAFDLKSA